MALAVFLFKVFVISFSGAMQPGPVTATAITLGTKNRYAGLLLSLGHVIIEFPVMVLIMVGLDKILKLTVTRVIIGLAGGAVLVIMAVQMFMSLKKIESSEYKPLHNKPVTAGIVLSVSNPYFLIWWATVGLALATQAVQFGIWAFGMFALTHWLVDCIWLLLLSWTSFKGSQLLKVKFQKVVLTVCAFALVIFGMIFIYDAVKTLLVQT
ncbi:MAG: LysE family transporter [Planctomycetota bacterium]